MASEQQARIRAMLNPPDPRPSPTPEQPPPQPRQSAPPKPEEWSVPTAPTSVGGKGIHYTESAMKRFAETSDRRAEEFQQIHAKAEQTQVDPDAFGFLLGRLAYSAYAQHAQSVTNGLISATNAMTEIADGVRDSAAAIQEVEAHVAHAAHVAHTGHVDHLAHVAHTNHVDHVAPPANRAEG